MNRVARSSTDEFFTLCDVHLEDECTSQAACLQRSRELLPLPQEQGLSSVTGAFPFFGPTLHESCGSRCRRGQLSRGHHWSVNVHRAFKESCSLDGIGGPPQHTKAILQTLASHGATPASVRGFSINDVNTLQVADRGHFGRPRNGAALCCRSASGAAGRRHAEHTILVLLLSLEVLGWRPRWSFRLTWLWT